MLLIFPVRSTLPNFLCSVNGQREIKSLNRTGLQGPPELSIYRQNKLRQWSCLDKQSVEILDDVCRGVVSHLIVL
jgi:hypothetical protein